MFQKIDAAPGDPILSLMEDFKADPRSEKVNLSIGLYYNGEGFVPQLDCVKEARQLLDKDNATPDLYLPMEGLAAYRQQVQRLLFGADSAGGNDERIATVQTVGGSGALKVGADFLKHFYPYAELWVSDPTWENHLSIFEGAGFRTHRYPYFNAETGLVDLPAMLACLRDVPAQSVVLLHPCCHNPTGADLTNTQWDEVIALLKERHLIPFLDMAYQGLGAGLEEDTYAIRAMERAGLNFLVSNSFSKIFSLYGDRIGALSVVCAHRDEAERVLSQLKRTIRRNYSSPPVRGAQIVTTILGDALLAQKWRNEVEAMRVRIVDMRQKLVAQLGERVPNYDARYLTAQRGMFSYTGLCGEQADRLREAYGIYILRSGRVCMAGLNDHTLSRVVEAIAQVLTA
ncbi:MULTISPECIES: amino acid aminotransferase [unclassified Saccharibacter]|uniref:amino acid aminotransferase n=1 Tax=unclassified Saccharibacter TaxID=2648722 RepID=UPI001320CB09|nr:aminotransferase class I/II-fold pyridoxal phosphate-dependent enzyme [Saccharibacter sp. EH611]MXV58519.1 aminotransferase class I/II-fold pyridoxal phosphate-dependent enzyme [Saccharibacter sp. EH70]MXV66025.1 aminotransferase class I/II-fold pyridoxal phosphate-dependent enzyme [Saccharibacter sp. EH60]